MTRPIVSVFLPNLSGGGAERAVLRVTQSLTERFDVDLVLATGGGTLIAETPAKARLVELGARRVATSIVPLARYLRRRRPEALLSSLNHANLVAIAARAVSRSSTRVLVVEQSTLSVVTDHAGRRADRIMPRLIGWLYPHADAVVAVSVGVADDLAEATGLRRDTISVIPNPVDVADLRSKAHGPAGHSWFDDEGPPVALAVGRLTEQKDFDLLLQAVQRVRARRELRLVVLGEGELRTDLERRVAELGLSDAVDLPGFVANPFPFFGAADVFVLSSRWEGMPTVLLEALAIGTSVVATDCPSGPSEILDSGRLGRLVPVGDADALAAAVEQTLDDPIPFDVSRLDAYAPDCVRDAMLRLLGLPYDGAPLRD